MTRSCEDDENSGMATTVACDRFRVIRLASICQCCGARSPYHRCWCGSSGEYSWQKEFVRARTDRTTDRHYPAVAPGPSDSTRAIGSPAGPNMAGWRWGSGSRGPVTAWARMNKLAESGTIAAPEAGFPVIASTDSAMGDYMRRLILIDRIGE